MKTAASGLKLLLLATACVALTASAATIEIKKVKRKAPVDFDKEIYPILKANCISCHNKTTSKAELNLETPAYIAKGGESGQAIIPGKGKESMLVRVAAHLDDPDMPPKDNKVNAVDLKPEELGLLSLWIDEGAKASPKVERKIAWEPLPAAFNSIYATALTPDGHFAAASRGGQIYLYHVPTRQFITRLTDDALSNQFAHRDLVPALTFSPDGKRLASGSYREIKIWLRDDAVKTARLPADPARAKELPAPSLSVEIAATKQHFTGEKTGAAALWDAEKKNMVRGFKHGAEINAVAASPDGSRVATSGVNNSVKLWDAATGALIAEVKGARATNDAAAYAARFGLYLQSETAHRNAELKQDEAELTKLEARVKTVTEDLKTAQAAIPPKVKLRDEAAVAKTALEKEVPPPPAAGVVEDAAAAKKRKDADDKLVAGVKKLADAETDVVRANEAAAHQQLELKLANEHVVKQQKFIADWKTAVTAAELAQKNAEAEAKKALDAANAQQKLVRALAFSPDGTQLAAAADDGQVHLWSAIDGAALRTLPGSGENPAAQRALVWDDKGITVTSEDGSRSIHQLATTWNLERTLGGDGSPLQDRVNVLRFSPDGKTIAAGSGEFSRSGELTLWNAETGALEKALPDLHKDTVLALCYTADGRLLTTGSADKIVKVLDTKTWAMVKSFEGHTNHVLGVAWRAEGRTLATAGADRVVKIWDFVSGDRKRNIEGWEGEVTAAQFVGLTNNFLAACGDKRVRLLNDSGGELRAFPDCKDYMQCVAGSDDGNVVIAGGQDGVLHVWHGATGKALVQFPAP